MANSNGVAEILGTVNNRAQAVASVAEAERQGDFREALKRELALKAQARARTIKVEKTASELKLEKKIKRQPRKLKALNGASASPQYMKPYTLETHHMRIVDMFEWTNAPEHRGSGRKLALSIAISPMRLSIYTDTDEPFAVPRSPLIY